MKKVTFNLSIEDDSPFLETCYFDINKKFHTGKKIKHITFSYADMVHRVLTSSNIKFEYRCLDREYMVSYLKDRYYDKEFNIEKMNTQQIFHVYQIYKLNLTIKQLYLLIR